VIGICFFCHWITYTFAVKVAGPSITVLGLATYGIQLIFYGSIFLGNRITKKNTLCLFLSLLGIGLVVPSWQFQDNISLGLCYALVSASFYAIIPIMLQKSREFNQETRIFYQFLISSIGYLFLIGNSSWNKLVLKDWSILFFLAIFGTFIAHTIWSKAVSQLQTTTTGIIYYLVTPISMVLSWLLLDEQLTRHQMLGGPVILIAALINLINQNRVINWYKKIIVTISSSKF
jgi:drug/metabolite transporter (DMT)-like permease